MKATENPEQTKLSERAMPKRMVAGHQFTTKRVTKDALPQPDGVAFAIKFEGKPHCQATDDEGSKRRKETMPPPILCDVLNLDDGAFYKIIMKAVLLSELDAAYPDPKHGSFKNRDGIKAHEAIRAAILAGDYNPAYVGKYFEITPKKPDKGRYNTYTIDELIP